MSENQPSAEHIEVIPEAVGDITFVGSASDGVSLLTVAAARALRRADLLVVSSLATAENLRSTGLVIPKVVEQAGDEEIDLLSDAVEAGKKVVRLYSRALHGDSEVEATVSALLERHPIRVDVIPSLSRWESALWHSAVATSPVTAFVNCAESIPEVDAWPHAGTVVVWSNPHTHQEVAARGSEVFGPDSPVLRVTDAGTTAQVTQLTTWRELDADDQEACLIVGDGIRQSRRLRLNWFESKPLFDWNIVVPRTKDPLDQLTDALGRYGASSEIVTTMSIEPPRTEQAMEKAVRGIVDGRFLWLVFTSPHAVRGVIERLAEFGLDSRALSGILLAAVGHGTADELALHGLRPDLVPSGDNTAAGLAGEFPAYDELMDPLNRVLIPSADVSVTPLLDGLKSLGWEPEEVTAYRTVRAAPPPAQIREKIKDGQFDAVVFTSATSVRNLIGIAGKPHPATVVAAIGQATANACEMHGLKVDVVSKVPNLEFLADALARFAEHRRADRIAQGLPDTKPSQRRRRKRRKVVPTT